MSPTDLRSLLGTLAPKESINFRSTRDKNLRVGFWESVVQGLASDGGLLVPVKLPRLPKDFFEKVADMNFADLAIAVLRMFISQADISDDELIGAVKRKCNFDLPLVSLDKLLKNSYVLLLENGLTGSFKDIAANILAILMEMYCERNDMHKDLVVATSGDTGVAIATAFGNSKRIRVTVLYPSKMVSPVQEKQMLLAHKEYSNVQVVPVLGNFDDCQNAAKLLQLMRGMQVEADHSSIIAEIKKKLKIEVNSSQIKELLTIVNGLDLTSANSINCWRLIPQATQYLVGYASLVRLGVIKPGDLVDYGTPLGNFGHQMAGHYIQEMGLPVGSFIGGTNANNINANIIGAGVIKRRQAVPTAAPSMDISDPSNLERFIDFVVSTLGLSVNVNYELMKQDISSICDGKTVRDISHYGITGDIHGKMKKLGWIEDVETDQELYAMMCRAFNKTGHIMEPHGTTALIAAIRARSKKIISAKRPIIIMETAHPSKFPTALDEAGLTVPKDRLHSKLSFDSEELTKPDEQKVDLQQIALMIKNLSEGKKE